jgi:hypothetical protein
MINAAAARRTRPAAGSQGLMPVEARVPLPDCGWGLPG